MSLAVVVVLAAAAVAGVLVVLVVVLEVEAAAANDVAPVTATTAATTRAMGPRDTERPTGDIWAEVIQRARRGRGIRPGRRARSTRRGGVGRVSYHDERAVDAVAAEGAVGVVRRAGLDDEAGRGHRVDGSGERGRPVAADDELGVELQLVASRLGAAGLRCHSRASAVKVATTEHTPNESPVVASSSCNSM